MDKLIIEPNYFPSISYTSLISAYSEVIIDGGAKYIKQTHRNRMDVLGANNVIPLSVPVVKPRQDRMMQDVQISYTEDWMKNHWRTIQSCYGKSPFFEFYEPYIRPFYEKKRKFLIDLTVESMTTCLKLLQIGSKISIIKSSTTEQETNFDGSISYNKAISLLKKTSEQQSKPYTQVFGNKFVPDLSIIDLLFCMGPESCRYLDES